MQNDLDQHDGQEDRKRIVGAGLDLDGGADARAQAQAARMHQEEHRRGIGRCDDGADQQRLGPAEIEEIMRDRRGDAPRSAARPGSRVCRPAPARSERSQSVCADRRRTESARARPNRPCRSADTLLKLMPPGPDSPASTPTARKISSSGAPNRSATRLDRMPVRTSTAPSRMTILIDSSAAIRGVSPHPW